MTPSNKTYLPGERVEWDHATDVTYSGIVKSVSQNGRIAFIQQMWPGNGKKYVTLDTDTLRPQKATVTYDPDGHLLHG